MTDEKKPDWNDVHRQHGTEGARESFDAAMTDAQQRAEEKVRADGGQATEVCREDFVAYMPQHNYFFVPTREPWPAASVNARIKPEPLVDPDGKPTLDDKGKPKFLAANTWLDQHRPVEQITWAPGEPLLIKDRIIAEGGWIERHGCSVLNLYRAPTIVPGNAAKAKPWLDHMHRIYPNEADNILDWFAQRVQAPHIKINHALVLGGAQGIGKDTAIEPVKRAVGHWNAHDVVPRNLFETQTDFLRSVILRVNEARDLGDYDRFAFYDHMKAIIAAPPDVLRVNEKHIRQYYVPNVCGVIITTNHKSDGIFLPAGDRRTLVVWSELTENNFTREYWKEMWHWYDNGGDRHVAAYLAKRDISGFDPKAPPPKTPAFWAIVDANRAPEDAELADALDHLGNPLATTLILTQAATNTEFQIWLNDHKNRRQIPHRFEKCGYVPVRNDAAKDGLWRISDKRQVVYAKAELPLRDQLAAARRLAGIEDVPE
jgi:hypothetical protein